MRVAGEMGLHLGMVFQRHSYVVMEPRLVRIFVQGWNASLRTRKQTQLFPLEAGVFMPRQRSNLSVGLFRMLFTGLERMAI